MELFLVLLACVIALMVVRSGEDRFYGLFTYRNGLQSPGNDGLGRARGIQEDDALEPWRLPVRRTDGEAPEPAGEHRPGESDTTV